MKIIGIAAVAENGIIGKNGNLPWHMPNDLKHFKETTKGHFVVMGYMTYKFLGKPLSERTNIVVTEQLFEDNRIIQTTSIEKAIEIAFYKKAEKVFIAGGAWTYKHAEPYITEWNLTIIHANIEGDTVFPIDINKLKLISNESYAADERHKYPYSFNVYSPVENNLETIDSFYLL